MAGIMGWSSWCGVSGNVTYNCSIQYTPTADGTVKVYTNQGVCIYEGNCVPAEDDANKITVTQNTGYAMAELEAGITCFIEFDAAWTVSKVEFTEKIETEEPEKPTADLTDVAWTVEDGSDIGYTVDSANKNKVTASDGTEVYGYKASFSDFDGDSTSYTKVTVTVKKKDGDENDVQTQEKYRGAHAQRRRSLRCSRF